MLCLDQLGDDPCDMLGHLRLVRVEVTPKSALLTHFTVARSISNSVASPGTKICRASTIPMETGLFPGNVTPVLAKDL